MPDEHGRRKTQDQEPGRPPSAADAGQSDGSGSHGAGRRPGNGSRMPAAAARRFAGVDVHAKSMTVCIVDGAGRVLLNHTDAADAGLFLETIKPFRPGVSVACECVDSYFWLADLCEREGIPFKLVDARKVRMIAESAGKSDRRDAETLAKLLRAGLLPLAYVYPKGLRGPRDLLHSRRDHLNTRTGFVNRLHAACRRAKVSVSREAIRSAADRSDLPKRFQDADARRAVELTVALLDALDRNILALERLAERACRHVAAADLDRLRTIPGVGSILSLTIVLEVGSLDRFRSRQKFTAYARLAKRQRESAGKALPPLPERRGNPYLEWAFYEAAVLAAQHDGRIRERLEERTAKVGKRSARRALAGRLCGAVYSMLKNGRTFDIAKFLGT
jgi:transposase